MRRCLKEKFKREKAYFESHGIKAGAWLVPSIGYGSLSYSDNDAYLKYTNKIEC